MTRLSVLLLTVLIVVPFAASGVPGAEDILSFDPSVIDRMDPAEILELFR